MHDGRPASDGVVAMLSVALDRESDEPLVHQLYRRLRELILSRQLAPGAKLPSTRKLCRDLDVSRTVTADAFGLLTAEGFLEARHGSGHFVAFLPLATTAVSAAARAPERAEPAASIWSKRGSPFDPSWLGVDLFPAQVWARMTGRGWRRHQSAMLERHWLGLPVLREALAEHLRALRGIALAPDQIMITAGNVDALALIARAARSSRRDPVSAWVEDPGLISGRKTLQREGLQTIPVKVDSEGLMIREGQRLAPGATLAIVTATRQFPLGMPLSLSRRLALLDWARGSGAIIVDDDYDGEIRFAGRPLQSLSSLDPTARALTLGSFSKLTFPGLRLGYAAGPPELIADLAQMRRDAHLLVPTGVQAALAEFIATGAFARHLRNLRQHLTRRRHRLIELLVSSTGGFVEILPQEVGMHLTVRLCPSLAERVSDVELAERAAASGVVLLPLSLQYSTEPREQGFLLGYAGWTEDQMEIAVSRFVKLLREAGGS